MKKLTLVALATLSTIMMSFNAHAEVSTLKYDNEQIRAMLVKTIVVNPSNDTFILMDDRGNTWVMDEIGDTEPGDFYLASYYTNHTSDVTDDVIISLTYTDTCEF